MNSLETLSLKNVAKGAVPEIFQRELEIVLQNINDTNTYAVEKRKITLEFEFKPNAERDVVDVTVLAKSKLVGVKAATGTAYCGGGKMYSRDPNQMEMNLSNVTQMEKKENVIGND